MHHRASTGFRILPALLISGLIVQSAFLAFSHAHSIGWTTASAPSALVAAPSPKVEFAQVGQHPSRCQLCSKAQSERPIAVVARRPHAGGLEIECQLPTAVVPLSGAAVLAAEAPRAPPAA